MIILGIDPGLARLGYGVIEVNGDKRRVIQFGMLTTPAGQPMPKRLQSLWRGMNQLLDIYNPDEVENIGDAKCIVAKNRHGQTGTIDLYWDGQYTRFSGVDYTAQ